ncbi:DUF2220 domain-containing protein [Luteolibacter flavescens]|uniref:DUF2220 domain-containing protein n=1 Tax=Luteolibacter flavescens TaxID=1859460 RepID=A0ABT3FUU2_9BACT|nr:DUF2220 domain-containing protein [Luteolibacter flavescens]MCW1887360.1 DUF2220 domain-containing protein [Luteolibacter flavescens]
MKTQLPLWLQELHRQWLAARGKQLAKKARAFSRDWERLLEDSGITSAEDIATAGREAARLHDEGRITLTRHKYRRYLIEKIALPLSSEEWLRGIFGSPVPEDLRQQSLMHLEEATARQHSRFQESWQAWIEAIRMAFADGKRLRPLAWQHPDLVRRLLDLTFDISSTQWPDGCLIREASVGLGLETKQLERSRRIIESCLTSMFRRPMSLDMLGIVGSAPRIEIAGELTLHFPDGQTRRAEELRGSYHLGSDLLEALRASTPSKRILTIENTKTTLRRIASLDAGKETLILACAYPSEGLRRILALLPQDLPIHHFGDTDPAGYQILSRLRRVAGRPVTAFLMHRREASKPVPLTDYDRAILPALLADPLLEDVRPSLEAIATSGDKGDFEQETLGKPDLEEWPFHRSHPAAPASP